MNKTKYYFTEKCLYEAFQACYSVIFAELNTQNAFILERDVSMYNHAKNAEYTENEICIDSVSVLKEQVAFLIKEFEIDLVAIYLTESDIQQRIQTIVQELSESEDESIVKDFSLEFVNDSNASVLFNVMFARQLALENVSNDPEIVENIIEYEDYDYTLIFDKINDCLEFCEQNGFEYEYDHIGGDVSNNSEYLELYYKFTKK
jgi:hypothetical protein